MTQRRRPVIWTIAAILLCFLAGTLDRKTEVEVSSDGRRVHLEVAGTIVSAPMALHELTGVEIRAMDSIDPPRGYRIVVEDENHEIFNQRLPRRFRFPRGAVDPVGDWELDERAAWASVWSRPVALEGPFNLTAVFGGRFHHDLDIVLHGIPTISVSVRRGLINNDAFIREADGTTLAATSIDPTPLADTRAVLATVVRAVAFAALLIALFTWLQYLSVPEPGRFVTHRLTGMLSTAALAVTAAALSVWFARFVLEGLPHLPDSVSYMLQSSWLLDGRLWGSVSPLQAYFDVPYTHVVGDRWLPHYPPGWPLLLSIGLAIGLPWLVAPVLGAIYVVLLYLVGREMDGTVTGVLAATLGVLSPLARVIFGSLLSHASAATLLLAAVWLVLLTRRKRDWHLAALAGIALGLAFGIRPLTAVAAAVPLGVVMVTDLTSGDDRRFRHCGVAWFVGGALAALPTLVTNHLITGSFSSFPYSLAGKPIYLAANLPFGIRNLDAMLYTAGAMVHGWGWPLFHGTCWVALSLAFALVPFLVRRHSAADVLLASIVVSVAVAHLGSRGHGLHGFGPRYLFEAFAPLFLLTARGFVELARPSHALRECLRPLLKFASATLFVILCGTAAVVLPLRLSLYRGYNEIDGSLERQVENAGLDRALVLLPTDEWQGWGSASRLMDPDPLADLLFIQAETENPEIWKIAGDRPIFAWRQRQLKPVGKVVDEFEAPTDTHRPVPAHPACKNREDAKVSK